MITLTTEQAQQIEEALQNLIIYSYHDGKKSTPYKAVDFAGVEAIATIRAAKAQEPAEQSVSQEYQDHLVNQSFDWAAMAAKHQFMEGYRIGLAEMREKCAVICEAKQSYSAMHANTEFAAVIRSINFEGDTGFRPVSEMIAEQEPVGECEVYIGENGEANFDSFRFTLPKHFPSGSYKLYAHPVRTKDLTDAEVEAIMVEQGDLRTTAFARAVIAADREKNR